MGLTRIRAEQISDIDYKQAVRVITVSNVTLSGGAPATVDGVNLVAEDRVLVAGQSTGSQNGLYYVQTVGAGSNGTWVRSLDGNETGELQAGLIVMVTEGNVYKDSQWKLTTNNPIIIGTTALVFEQNSAYAFGNIYANGTAVLANAVGDTVTLTAGDNIAITGNNTTKTVTIGVTGISLNSIANGTSNVTVVSSGGNVSVGVGGTSNVAVFSTAGVDVTGSISATGNLSGGNLVTTGLISATGNINTTEALNINSTTGNYNVLNISGPALVQYGTPQTWKFFTNNIALGTSGSWIVFPDTSIQTTAYPGTSSALSLSGNITGGNLISNVAVVATGNVTGGNLTTTGIVSATGNITGDNILGNGASLSGINVFSNITVSGGNSCLADSISDTLTLTAGDGIVLIADSATDTITIAASGTGESIFATGGDMGLVTEAATTSEDLGSITTSVTESYDLGGFFIEGFVSNDNFLVNSINGNILTTNAVISTTGNITAGNLTTTDAVYSNFNTNAANTASFNATGGNTKGGTGYLDFLVARNTSGGATNPYKWLRLNSTGSLEIINSAYSQNIFSLEDNGTLTIPGPLNINGTQAVNGPAFSAYANTATTIASNGSLQKVNFLAEEYDTNSNFASSRFTPTIAGYYQFDATVRLDGGGTGTGECMIVLFKNGSEYKRGWNSSGTQFAASWWSMSISAQAYANGSTDYFEIYVQQGSGADRTTTAFQNITYFQGCMVRGA